MEPRLLRVTEAAKIAGVGRTFAYEFVQSGEWPSVKIGRVLRVPLAGLMAWIGEREKEAEDRAVALRGEAGVAR